MMKDNFRFENLGSEVIKEVLYHLSDKDKVNLLSCCKVWNKVVIPMLWENTIVYCRRKYRKDMYNSFKKYGHYVKSLDIMTPYKIPYSQRSICTNNTRIHMSLNKYIEYKNHFKNASLVGLYCTNSIENMQINEYMYENEEYIREKFQHLEHLVLDNSDDLEYYFKAPIIRYLPPTITSLIIQNSPFASFLDLRELVNKFDNLTILELVHIRVDISDFDFLLKKQLPRLNKLHLAFSYGIDIEGICINLDNYPKLEALDIEEDSASGINVISKLKGLTFRGVSNLRKLIMSNVSLVKVIINKETFPKLNQLSLQWCSTLLSKPLYSIFDVSTITFLDISVASYPIFEIFTIIHSNPPEKEYRLFLIKEIYPKHATNLLTLRVQNLVLGYHFFNFLFTLCPNLYNLEIAICSFENDIPFSKHPVVRESTLTNVTFTNIESPNADAFINFILFYFKNISSFKLVNCSDLFPKYKHDPRFCLCKSR